jgi:nitrogenase subunit NifH
MPYHVCTRSGHGALGIVVDTARQALEKAAQFAEEGHSEVIFKDVLGNIVNRATLVALAGEELRPGS